MSENDTSWIKIDATNINVLDKSRSSKISDVKLQMDSYSDGELSCMNFNTARDAEDKAYKFSQCEEEADNNEKGYKDDKSDNKADDEKVYKGVESDYKSVTEDKAYKDGEVDIKIEQSYEESAVGAVGEKEEVLIPWMPHKCTICDKQFTQAPKLKRHMLIHTGDKTHKCDICGKTFTQARSLKQHQSCWFILVRSLTNATCVKCRRDTY